MQLHAFFDAGETPYQRFSRWTYIVIFRRVIDKGIVVEAPISFGSRGQWLGHIRGDIRVGTSQDFLTFEIASVSRCDR